MAYRSVPRPSSPLSAKASTRYPYDTSSLSLSMARAARQGRAETTEDGRQSTDQPIHAPSGVTQVQPRPMVRLAAQPKDLCFTCPRRIAVKPPITDAPLPRPGPGGPKRKNAETSSGSTGPRRLAARSPMIGHIHSSRCRRTGSQGSKPKRRPNLVRRRIPLGGREASTGGRPSGDRTSSVLRRLSSVLARLGRAGGARRDRTDDLMLAKHALSQLSYGPGQTTDDRPRRTQRTSSVLCRPKSDPGGPGKTRTSDLTLIKRAL